MSDVADDKNVVAQLHRIVDAELNNTTQLKRFCFAARFLAKTLVIEFNFAQADLKARLMTMDPVKFGSDGSGLPPKMVVRRKAIRVSRQLGKMAKGAEEIGVGSIRLINKFHQDFVNVSPQKPKVTPRKFTVEQ